MFLLTELRSNILMRLIRHWYAHKKHHFKWTDSPLSRSFDRSCSLSFSLSLSLSLFFCLSLSHSHRFPCATAQSLEIRLLRLFSWLCHIPAEANAAAFPFPYRFSHSFFRSQFWTFTKIHLKAFPLTLFTVIAEMAAWGSLYFWFRFQVRAHYN